MPTYYAQYDIDYATVTWNAQGGTASESSRQVQKGKPVGTLPTWTRSGYTFNGWFTAANGGSQINASTIVNNNVTYYAQFDTGLQSMIIKGSNFSNIYAGNIGFYSGSWVTLTNIPSDANRIRFRIIDTAGAERKTGIVADMGSLASQVGIQYGMTPQITLSDYNAIINAGGKIGISCTDMASFTVQKIHTYVDNVLLGENVMNFTVSHS